MLESDFLPLVGVYANSEFQEDDLILKDQILVGIQHSSNKVTYSFCSFMFLSIFF